ncbi:MAG: helix-turn-helix transcriptional regulator [Clostridia bacterium]|nr:helix-turn-helix transcriptional regulator [Clostridia bacterium]
MELSSLYEMDFYITDFIAMQQSWWTSLRAFNMLYPRKDDALLLFLTGGFTCVTEDKKRFSVPSGSLVHIARGCKYRWEVSDDEEKPFTLLFEFTLKDKQNNIIHLGDGVSIIDSDSDGAYEMLFGKLIKEFSRPNRSPVFQKACAYSLFSLVIKRARKQQLISGSSDFDIYPGIKYLESDIEQSKSIEEIAHMCNMSLSSFERRFKAYSGMSPVEYRLSKKLDRAEIMLKTGSMTLERIAEELNFYDGAYLCRIFKKKKGYSPSSFRKTQ